MAKLLLVDDEYAIVEILSGILETEGHTVATAANGEEGMKRLEEDRPDLVILDVMMPRLSGSDMLKRMRNDPRYATLPVVMISAVGRFRSATGDHVRFVQTPL